MQQIAILQLAVFIEHLLLRQVVILMLTSGYIGSDCEPEELRG